MIFQRKNDEVVQNFEWQYHKVLYNITHVTVIKTLQLTHVTIIILKIILST